jgi:AcrR family transcriptional regulator
MPRRYRLGERAAQMETTRDRILEAAVSLSIEVGLSAATMREIGLRADVAPGTLRNHFPTRELLEQAMVKRLTADAPLPDVAIFDGVTTLDERVRRLAVATGRFLDGAARIYRMWLREPMLSGVWAETGAVYGARWDLLMRTALGALADDADSMALLRAVLQPTFYDALRSPARTTDDVSAWVAALITPWLAARQAERG